MNSEHDYPLSEQCKTCTQFLNERLPHSLCYAKCPKNNAVKDIENSLNHNIRNETKPIVCPKCSSTSLYWSKSRLLFECLNPKCSKIFTEADLKIAYLNAKMEQKYTGYMDDGGWVG